MVTKQHFLSICIATLDVLYIYAIGGHCLLSGIYYYYLHQLKNNNTYIARAFLRYGWVSIGFAIYLTITSLMSMRCNINRTPHRVVTRLHNYFTFSWLVIITMMLSRYDYNDAHLILYTIFPMFGMTGMRIYLYV